MVHPLSDWGAVGVMVAGAMVDTVEQFCRPRESWPGVASPHPGTSRSQLEPSIGCRAKNADSASAISCGRSM